jgi:uncharacterized protein
MLKTVLLALLMPVLALAAVPAIHHPVTDPSGMLTAGERETVSQALVTLRAERQVQMAVLLVDTTAGQPIEDYAHAVFEGWKGGDKGRDNGLLLVIAREDRRSRLEVGYGLEEFLTDGESTALLRAQGPLLREGRMEAALLAIIEGVRAEVAEGAVPPGGARVKRWSPEEKGAFFIGLVLTALCVGRGLWALRRPRFRGIPGVVMALLLAVIPPAAFMAVAQGSPMRGDSILAVYVATLGVFTLGWYVLPRGRYFMGLSLLLIPSVSAGAALFWTPEVLSNPDELREWMTLVQFLVASAVMPAVAIVLAFVQPGSSDGGGSWSSSSSDSSSSSSSSSSSDWTYSSSSSSYDSSSSYSSSDSSSSSSDWSGGGGSSGGGGGSDSW